MGKIFNLKLHTLIHLAILLSVPSSFAKDPKVTMGATNTNVSVEFDVSGQKPPDGADGLSYEGQRAAKGTFAGDKGANSRPGEDGEDVPRAEDGESRSLYLKSAFEGVVSLSGTFVDLNGGSLKVKIRNSGFIRAITRGGDGAKPGNGGWSEAAGHGQTGYTGTGRQRGGPGGDGGEVKAPGRGWNGGDAGDAGNALLGIPIDELELGWLIQTDLRGGKGADHSKHGRAGAIGKGAPGGPGGRYQVDVEVPDNKTVKNDDGTTTIIPGTKTVKQWRQAPSGSWGSDSRPGPEINIPLYRGKDGKDGKETWVAFDENDNVVLEAGDRFQLNLIGFNFVDTGEANDKFNEMYERLSRRVDETTRMFEEGSGDFDQIVKDVVSAKAELKAYEDSKADGIFEPNEKGYITNIFVKNNGGLPTPGNAKTRLKLKIGNYYFSSEITFDIPEGLQPGEVALVKGPGGEALRVPFHVKDFSHVAPTEAPFVRSEMIVPVGEADVNGEEFTIPEFNDVSGGKREFTVQYPVLIEPVTTLPSLSPGEASKHIVRITNISGRDFGAESELKRHLELFIQRSGGDLTTEELGIEFFNMEGSPLKINDGILKSIMKLKAGESTTIETIVGVSPAAESYRRFDVSTGLRIDRNGFSEGEDLETIQERSVHVKIANDYFKTADSDFLLITNNRLSRDAFVSWKNIAEDKMNSSIDTWDMSYKDFITFMSDLGEYGEKATTDNGYSEFRTSLAEQYAGKTIIIMANEFESTGQEAGNQNVWDFINMRDLRSACALYGINLYILGGESQGRLNDIRIPRAEEANDIIYSTFKELYKAVKNQEGIVSAKAVKESPYWETSMKGLLSRWRWFIRPGEGLAKRKAKALYDRAMRENPDADFQSVHRLDVSKKSPLWWSWGKFRPFGSHWDVGKIQLYRSTVPDMGHVVSTTLTDAQISGNEYVNSRENLMNLYLGRSMEENLKDFEHYMSQYDKISEGKKDALPVLIKAIGKLLVLEQVKLRHRAKFLKNRGEILGERLRELKELSELDYKFKPGLPEDLINEVTDMIVDVYYYAKKQPTWGVLFRSRNAKISTYAKSMLGDIITDFYSDIMDKNEVKRHFKKLLKKKRADLKGETGSWSEVTLANIDIDDLIDGIPNYRGVISGEEFDAQQERLRALDVQAGRHSTEVRGLRDELEVSNPMLDRLSMGVPAAPTEVAPPPPVPGSCKSILSK